MTRKSPREIERMLADLTPSNEKRDNTDPLVAFEDPETGAWLDSDGNPLEADADPLVVIKEEIIETDWGGGGEV